MASEGSYQRAFGAIASFCVLVVFGEEVVGYDLPWALVWLFLAVGISALAASAYFLGRSRASA